MNVDTDRTGTLSGLKKSINEVLKDKDINGLLILSCDENNFTYKDLNRITKKITVPIIGAIFPALLYGHEKLQNGSIVVGLKGKVHINMFQDLSKDTNYEDRLTLAFPDINDIKTAFVFVDGFSRNISLFIDAIFNVFGLEFNFIGGGAGSLNKKHKPCIFTNNGIFKDAAIIALTDIKSGVGVKHGWRRIDGPLFVSESNANTIKTLNWRPAYDIYKEIVERHSGIKFREDNFLELSKTYPFGINRIGGEMIVRDPFIKEDDGSLTCIGDVQQGSYIDILTGDIHSLIHAAGKAFIDAEKSFGNTLYNSILYFDCISRVLFLGEEFSKEISQIYKKGINCIGACTIGEIANTGKEYLEFYNKTIVIGLLE